MSNSPTIILNTRQGLIVKIGYPDTKAAYEARVRRAEKKTGAKLVPVAPNRYDVLSEFTHGKKPKFFGKFTTTECVRTIQRRAAKIIHARGQCDYRLTSDSGRGWVERIIESGRVHRLLARYAFSANSLVINFGKRQLP